MSGKTFVQVEIPATENYQQQNGIAMFSAEGTASTIGSGSTMTGLLILVWTESGFTSTHGWTLTDSATNFSLNINPTNIDQMESEVESEFIQAFTRVDDNSKGNCLTNLTTKYSGCVNWP